MTTANNSSVKLETYPTSNQILGPSVAAQTKESTTRNALITITNKIRRSLDFSVIGETVTQEMMNLLEADRVAIYQFNPDWSGRFVFEAVGPEWIPLVEAQHHNDLISKNVSSCSVQLLDTHAIADTHLQVTYGGSFVKGEIFRVCEDVYNAGFSDCYVDVLKSYQARSYVIIAIYLDEQLWGLLAVYQNAHPRRWQQDEVQLLVQAAEQLGIALKQAEYVRTIQSQTIELQETLQQLKKSQAQLVQNEKMAGLGQLVAGVAHEINNPVNFIHANLPHVEGYMNDLLSLVQLQQKNPQVTNGKAAPEYDSDIDLEFILEDLPKTIASMRAGSVRIRDIVQSLRNFSRLDETGLKQVDLHEGIESTLAIITHQLAASHNHPKIEVMKDYGDVSTVECDPAQINQVLLALLTNATESLKEACRVENMKNNHSDWRPQLWISTQMNEQKQAVIRIQDNGPGIEADHRSKVFDHFFTTKPVGQGTGLGLAIARQIIEDNHGGTLRADS
ncbi:MAG: GAF domain-containing protein [Cyanobacteria bacterium J06648_10]